MSASASKDLQEAATHSTSDATQPPIAAGENLACQWEKCTERCVSAVALFDHICDKHIGRKSTNNLNLTCGWASCRTTTVKRDHITSHVRVHVPLKPHKCDFCKKAFKRPQDLKKHVKTHADDSVLRSPNMNSPGANKSVHMMNALQYRGGAPSSAYYGQGVPMAGAHGPYGSVHPSQNGYYSQQQPPYGPVYYPSSHGGDAGHHSYDSRKRGYETLNEFFGDAKRRQIDPTSYTQVGQRLMSLQGIPLQQGEMAEYMSTEPSLVPVGGQHGGNHGHLPSHQYALPLPNLRTKTDLLNIDQFLEQMQSTVYESSNAAAAAGVHQPGAHYTHAGVNFRQSHSPPQTNVHHLGNVNSSMPSSHSAPIMSNHSSSQSNSSNAPTLTPSSSKMSYTSGNSPVSSQGMSPVIKSNRTTSSAYPTLPTASLSYPSHPTAAPTSTLGPTFNNDPRRRYSGGMLQKSSNPPADSDDLNCINGSTDLTPHENSKAASQAADNIDPALAEVSSPMDLSDGSESARDRAEESWIENIRVIEALRSMVSDRLRRKEYEAEDEDVSMTDVEQKTIKTEPKDSESLYPNLRSKFESTE